MMKYTRCFYTFFCLLLALFMAGAVQGQVTVFSDNFNSLNSDTWTTGGALGAWTVTRSGVDWGARRNTSPQQLELTNDASADANVNGWVMVSTPTTSFDLPYTATLNEGGAVTWSFNIRTNRDNLAGFAADDNYGMAFILAGTANTSRQTGNGIAVVLGNTGEIDPLRLVSYTGGLANTTNIVVSNTSGLDDFGTQHLSVRVVYTPCDNNRWDFYVRNDGTSFNDPLSETGGPLVFQGSANSVTHTGTSLPMMATYWQGSTTANQLAWFDNVTVLAYGVISITIPGQLNICATSSSAQLTYTNLEGFPDRYSIDYNAAAEAAGFSDVVNAVFPAGNIILGIPWLATAGTYSGTLTVFNTVTGCAADPVILTIELEDCSAPPSATWVLLNDEGEEYGSCVSQSDCDDNIVCYGLLYTPNSTGYVQSYGVGLTVDCTSLGAAIVSQSSCVMGTSSTIWDFCSDLDFYYIAVSGNSGSQTTSAVTAGQPVVLHQVCFSIPAGENVQIVTDVSPLPQPMAVSVVTPTITIDEFPVLGDYTLDPAIDCFILPVTWLDFNVSRYGPRATQLDWTTADEVNNSHFVIERSNDGGKSFSPIGRVDAADAGRSINVYQWIDTGARTGRNYYRIRQVDNDGRSGLSPIRSLDFEGAVLAVTARPNPATTDIDITITDASESGSIHLIDITGQEVLTRDFDAGFATLRLDVSSLRSGVYTLIVAAGQERIAEKVVVLD